MSTAVEARLERLWETPNTLWGRLTTVDHKIIAKRYLVTAMIFLIAGGIEALIIRLQLARSNSSLLTPEMYDQIFSMHAVTMIFWYASPILSGFAVYFVPLLIGARDMAYPRLNAFTYWSYLFSGLFLYASALVGQSPHGGWFAYVPFTSRPYSPGLGMDFYALALIFLTISTEGGALNFVVTIFHLRAPGMSVSKMPLFLYSTLTISCAIHTSFVALTHGWVCFSRAGAAVGLSLFRGCARRGSSVMAAVRATRDRRTKRDCDRRDSARLAGSRYLLRGGPLTLRSGRRQCLSGFCRVLLLAAEDYRTATR